MNARPSGKTARTLQWCRRHPARALRMLFWVWLVIGGTYLAKHLRRERIANLQKAECSASNAQLGRLAGLIDSNTGQARTLLLDQQIFPAERKDFT